MNKRINRYSADASSALPKGLFTFACVAIAAALIWNTEATVAFAPLADYWSHVAVLREWLHNFTSPGNPFVNDTALTQQFVPVYWLLALLGRGLGLDAIQLMTVAALANFLLLASGLKLFLYDYFRHAWAPFIGLVVMFFCWGVAGAGPGNYQFSNFFVIAGGPSTFAFALDLIAFWASMRLLRSSVTMPLWAIALLILIALAFISDPLTGIFGAVGCMLLAGTEFSSSALARPTAFAALLAGLAAAELWPYFSAWKWLLGLYETSVQTWAPGSMAGGLPERSVEVVNLGLLYDPAALLAVFGVSLLGLPLLFILAQRGEQPFIYSGAALMLVPYGLNLLIDMPVLAYTCLLFSAFYLQLALAWGWLRLISAWSEIPRPLLAAPMLLTSIVAGAVLVAGNSWLVQQAQHGRVYSAQSLQLVKRSQYSEGLPVPVLYEQLLAPLESDAVVLADAAGSPVPAFGHKLVSPPYTNPLLPDMRQRARSTADFFGESLTDLERVAIVQRYSVSHVLMGAAKRAEANPAGLSAWLNNYSKVVSEQGDLRVYELAAALHQVQLPQPDRAPDTLNPPRVPDTVRGQTRQQQNSQKGDEADTTAEQEQGQEQNRDAPRSFGAPIAAPVLDPERHGG